MDNATDYLRKMQSDLVAQFRRQPNTAALMAAVAKQLQAVYETQEQLNTLRWLNSAEGRQLDGIGEIVVLSRADAARLELGKPDASRIDDGVYRTYLYYKMFLNTSTGTRKEIMKALRFFWSEAPLYYSEDTAWPATIFVDTPELAPDIPIEGLLEAPIVKPAGVRFIVRIRTRTANDLYNIRFRGLSVVKITKTQVLDVDQPEITRQLRPLNSPQWKKTRTQIGNSAPLSARLKITHAAGWKITRTDTGEYVTVAEGAQNYHGLATVKITKTPLAAYGGE